MHTLVPRHLRGRAPAVAALLLALSVVLSGCSVVIRPGASSTSSAVHSENVIVWAALGLQLHFPGAVVEQRHAGPHHFDTVFRSDASIHSVYDDVDSRMRAHGWHRTRYSERHDRITAEYVRGGEHAKVDVNQEGHSGRYKLKIDD